MVQKILLAAMLSFASLLNGQNTNFRLVFEDNFNGDQLNTGNWVKIPRGKSDWNRHMSDDPTLYHVGQKTLTLYSRINTDLQKDTAAYITGGISTQGKRGIKYGRVEVRAKLENAKGSWPAIWMLPETGKWPYGGEIDIMEHLNYEQQFYQTIHTYYTYILGHKTNPENHTVVPADPTQYNVYGVEIRPDRIVFLFNGETTFVYPKVEALQADLQFPFGAEPFYLLIDMQVGGSWVGAPDPQDYPTKMQVDWVKMYELVEE